mmetsp:Transcript_5112/g.18945  ORF Transcript_5112/g.18945 Transcript_5112/m.18945 type:complete len:336 (-) Transcript_5112:77-1084(-)
MDRSGNDQRRALYLLDGVDVVLRDCLKQRLVEAMGRSDDDVEVDSVQLYSTRVGQAVQQVERLLLRFLLQLRTQAHCRLLAEQRLAQPLNPAGPDLDDGRPERTVLVEQLVLGVEAGRQLRVVLRCHHFVVHQLGLVDNLDSLRLQGVVGGGRLCCRHRRYVHKPRLGSDSSRRQLGNDRNSMGNCRRRALRTGNRGLGRTRVAARGAQVNNPAGSHRCAALLATKVHGGASRACPSSTSTPAPAPVPPEAIHLALLPLAGPLFCLEPSPFFCPPPRFLLLPPLLLRHETCHLARLLLGAQYLRADVVDHTKHCRLVASHVRNLLLGRGSERAVA